MNKKIKVIDIFKMFAKGEQPPKKIKCIDREFYFQENETTIDYLYRTDINGNGWLVVQDIGLNDEVEILDDVEDNTEEIEELKYDVVDENGKGWYKLDTIADKVTELVKRINYIERKINDN